MEKLQVGDNVEIINYGHISWANNESEVYSKDVMPQLIGKKGVIKSVKLNKYHIEGIIGKCFPFDKDQLKKL